MKYEDLERVNKELKTTPIKGKDYVEVNQRIKAFRMLYPEGFIKTELISNIDGVCIMRAEVGYNIIKVENDIVETKPIILGTGIAYEKEDSTFINKTSYIENCETSAVGRALGMCGLGIDTSVASAEEVENAMNNQDKEMTTEDILKARIKKYGSKASEILKEKNKKLSELTTGEMQQLLETLENEN